MTDRVHFDDLTAINVPYGLLDDDTQKRLRDCGGPLEGFRAVGGWIEVTPPAFSPSFTYRQASGKPLIVHHWNMLADWVQYVARDKSGDVWAYECKPEAHADWLVDGGDAQPLNAISPRLIDPGTCHWTKAIAERPK